MSKHQDYSRRIVESLLVHALGSRHYGQCPKSEHDLALVVDRCASLLYYHRAVAFDQASIASSIER